MRRIPWDKISAEITVTWISIFYRMQVPHIPHDTSIAPSKESILELLIGLLNLSDALKWKLRGLAIQIVHRARSCGLSDSAEEICS